MPDTPYSRGSIRRIKLPGVGSMLESSGIFVDWLPRMADSLFWIQRIGLRSCYIECRPRAQSSEAGDEDYFTKALLDYEAEFRVPFKLRHYWEWEQEVSRFGATKNDAKRSKTSGSSSFNTESRDPSINLSIDAGDDDEDDVSFGYQTFLGYWGTHLHPSSSYDLTNEIKNLSKRERQLTYLEQAFIVKAASVNIGATRAHHLLTGDSDAQMLIHKMENRKKHVSDFSEFGDIVSFDATFKTNKYKMVFVPFTAIDNHRKCDTVAAGLLKNESTKSYIWLLKAFIKAFGKAPSIVVTDQDGAMRNAIEAEFAGSKHRLCMWHITQKLPTKICAKIYDETDFKEKLNKIVWNMYIGPKEFEYKWGKLMEEFKLENHKWLIKMFNIRSTWIPAYFIDSPLCGLMRTTSRSESENSFFSHFTNSGSTLMNFMNCFETAMEKQRHVQERMDHNTIDIVPKLKIFLKIECHASNVYTRSLFELVQKEIFVGLRHCQIDSKSLVKGSEVCILKDSPYVYEMPKKKKKKPQSVDKAKEDDIVDLFFKKDGLYKVLRNVGDGSVVCSCQLFVRVGILCKHIFCVFKNGNVEMIPQQYILRRWTKNLISVALRNKKNKYGEKNMVVENFANAATLIVDHCVYLLSKDEPRLGAFVEKLKSLNKEVEADCSNPPSKNKTDNLEQLVGVPKPVVVDVNNPTVGSTKGQKKLCIKGGKEKAIEKSLKGRNSCSLCGGTDHNKRTCPGRFEVQDEVVVQKEVCQEEVVVQKEVCQEEVVQEKVDLAEDEEELFEEDEDLIHE
ncbi:protein FAR1-related sequence 5 [Tanacetum coccineum]